MNSDNDLDTFSQHFSHVELVYLNLIHMIQIILYVTPLYIVGINEAYTVIILSNSCMFPMIFVFFGGYYSFLFTANN